MLISFACPHCGSDLEVDAEEAGTRVDCPACSDQIRTPLPRVAPGTTLGGFLIERRIGGGAMGEVFLARQLSMDRLVALKVLPQALTRKSQIVERFRNEVRMSARLEHPHAVTAFEAGEDFGYHFLAMSYVDGEDLGTVLKRDGPIPERKALRYARQAADALCYAWNAYQMLHRDVKPSNIMVDNKDNARLLDLGISKSLAEEGADEASLTVSGMLVGTPHYMSPEQALNEADVDFRADIYSLGATLYHLLTGSTPYTGKTTVEVIRQIATPIRPLRELQPGVSERSASLVDKMMAPDLTRRHPRWESVLIDIDRVMDGRDPLLPVSHVSRPHPGQGAKDSAKPADAAKPTPDSGSSGPARPTSTTPNHQAPARADAPPPKKAAQDSAPPQIDLRSLRMAWLRKQFLRRTIILCSVLVFLLIAAVVARRAGFDDFLRDRLARWLAADSAAGATAENSRRYAASVRNQALADAENGQAATSGETVHQDSEDIERLGESLLESRGETRPEGDAEAAPDDHAGALPDTAAGREAARVLQRALDEVLRRRPENAEVLLRRAAREDLLSDLANELYRVAAVVAGAAREQEMLVRTLRDEVGTTVTLALKNGPARVKILRVDDREITALRLHESEDTPLGHVTVPLEDLAADERIERLRQFEKSALGDMVLTAALWREGRREEALRTAERLPPMLTEAFRQRLQNEGEE